MKVPEILSKAKNTLFSFELLPPLKGKSIDEIYNAIDPLMEFDPVLINITYHQEEIVYKKRPGGLLEKKTVRKRPGTVAIAAAIKYRYKTVHVVPHIICGGFTKEETENALIDLHFLGIRNLLVLRGDPEKSVGRFIPEEGGHANALGLVKQIRNMNRGRYLDEELENTEQTDFTVGVAGYPEKHIEAPNMKADLNYLKQKVDAGAEFIVTQMFFDNQKYFDFVDACRSTGITVPIIPGLKPVAIKNHLSSLPKNFNIDLPEALTCEMEKCKTSAEVRALGVEWAVQQSKELMEHGVPIIHFYTMGKSDNIRQIAKQVF